MTVRYIGSGPYCYANSLAMALGDGTDPGLAGHEPLPRLFGAYGDGRDEPDAGDDDPSLAQLSRASN